MDVVWAWLLLGAGALSGLATLALATLTWRTRRAVLALTGTVGVLRTEMDLVHRRQRQFHRAQQMIYRQLASLQESQAKQTAMLREMQDGARIADAVAAKWIEAQAARGHTTFAGTNTITGPVAGGDIGRITKPHEGD